MKTSSRNTKGQFKNGTSGNPAGRPAGSRNSATLVCEQLLEGDAGQLISKAVELAKKGNIHALRLCLERIVPPCKERRLTLELRPIVSAQDLPIQFQDITTAIAEGRITPGEGESLSNILASHARIVEIADFDQRLAALETNREEVKSYRSELDQLLMKNGGLSRALEGRKE